MSYKVEEFKSINPANSELIWRGMEASAGEIDELLLKARKAFKTWSALSFDERAGYVEKFLELVEKNKESLAITLCRDNGKALWEARNEINGLQNKYKIAVQAHKERCAVKASGISILRSKPHGVVAVFGPYNFPVHVVHGHVIPALLAGNVVVLKPSELTPFISEEIVRLWHQAGLPEGVLTLVQGKVEPAKYLSQHPQLDGLFFTGSSKTGKAIHKNFAGNPSKILALELGGNNPLVFAEVEDLKAAAQETILSAFITAGQRCTCARRLILVDNEESNKFLDELIEMSSKIIQGMPEDEVFMGPLISKEQAQILLNANESLKAKGAKVLLEMKHKKELGDAFVSPGILDCTGIKTADEEYFGPLLQVYKVKDFDAAIAKANDTNYGLSAALLSDNESYYEKFYREIRAGLINWNKQTTGASSQVPFGGVGDSGNFRPSAYYAADYCSYPVASMEQAKLEFIKTTPYPLLEHDD